MSPMVGVGLTRFRRGTSPGIRFAAVAAAAALVAATPLAAFPPAKAAAGEPRAVTNASDVAATWTSDSSAVIFSRYGADGTWSLWRQRLDRTTPVPVFGGEDAWRPRVSPDGTKVAFTGARHIHVLTLATGREVNVGAATGLAATREASWSPNGSRLTFAGEKNNTWRIYTSNADGSGAVLITAALGSGMPLTDPVWSPDGSTIAFRAWPGVVKLVNPDGSNERLLSSEAVDASWSPDSSQLVITSTVGGMHLRIVNLDGSVVQDWPSAYDDQQPSWSPHGNLIAFTRNINGRNRIWVRSLGPDIPAPTPPPPPSVSIDAGAIFTNSPQVTLHVTAPETARTMTVSNDGGFYPARTFEADNRVPWTLISSGADRLPKTVYVRFDGAAGVYTDDIILDETDPAIASATITAPLTASAPAAERTLTRSVRTRVLRLKASDNRSGVRQLQVNRVRSARGATTLRFDTRLRIRSWRRTFVRVRDGAGNWCPWRRARRAA